MGKQHGKKTLAVKKAEASVPTVKKQFVPKPKGPVPASYAQNYGRIAEQKRLEFAAAIADAREDFHFFVKGEEHGLYLVGINTTNDSEGYMFEIKTVTMPEKDDMPAYSTLVIEGEVEVYGTRIYIPHKWLFFGTDTCRFLSGRKGEVQYQMLTFLKMVLAKEIQEEKQHYYKKKQAEKEVLLAEKKKKEATEKVAVSENKVVSIQTAMRERGCNKLEDLESGKPGLYDFSEGDNALVLELRHGKRDTHFFVKKVSMKHSLNTFLLQGCIIPIKTMRHDYPELDAFIRARLEISGISLSIVKVHHNNRALVYEGLPNVNTSTATST